MTLNNMLPSSPLFHQLEFLKLDDINNLQTVSFVYECINGLTPQYFENFFRSLSSAHFIGTRQSKKSNLFLERKILSNMGSGPFIMQMQNSGIQSPMRLSWLTQ